MKVFQITRTDEEDDRFSGLEPTVFWIAIPDGYRNEAGSRRFGLQPAGDGLQVRRSRH